MSGMQKLDPWVEAPSKVVLPRVAVVVKCRPGVHVEELREALAAHRPVVSDRVPSGSAVRLGVRLGDDPLGSGVDDWDAMPIGDAYIEVSWPEQGDVLDVTAPLRGLCAALELIDRERSVAVAGTGHLLEIGTGAIALAGVTRRTADTTHEELINWWHHHHGPLVLSILDPKPLGYQQLHPDLAASRIVASAAGLAANDYDMFASSYFASVDDFAAPLARPGVSERLRADEEGHYDHASMFGGLFRVF